MTMTQCLFYVKPYLAHSSIAIAGRAQQSLSLSLSLSLPFLDCASALRDILREALDLVLHPEWEWSRRSRHASDVGLRRINCSSTVERNRQVRKNKASASACFVVV